MVQIAGNTIIRYLALGCSPSVTGNCNFFCASAKKCLPRRTEAGFDDAHETVKLLLNAINALIYVYSLPIVFIRISCLFSIGIPCQLPIHSLPLPCSSEMPVACLCAWITVDFPTGN
jgi:hypothetical protein